MKIVKHKELGTEPVSHNPEISKRVVLKNGEIPNITQLAETTLAAGQCTSEHAHIDMAEIYILIDGSLEFSIDDDTVAVTGPATAVIYPGERHSIANKSGRTVRLQYIGVLSPEEAHD